MITIPLTGGAINAHQIFFIQLGDNFLEIRINYITNFDHWSMNILRDGVPMVTGAMLVSGEDVVRVHDAGLGRFLMVGVEPTLDNLGQANKLVWENV